MIIVFPAVTKFIIDDVIAGHRPELLVPMVAIALLAFFLQDFLNALRILLNNSFEQRVIFDLRSDLFRHIELLPLRWFDNRATGDLITRVVEDVNAVERVLIDGIEQGVVAVLQVAIVIATLFYFNGHLAWCVLAPVPLLAAGAAAYTLTGPKRYRPQRRAAYVPSADRPPLAGRSAQSHTIDQRIRRSGGHPGPAG
jgi:ABC-type bacteriocin/lantibiotic exporter with double-glycine peptidase domain